MIRVMVLQVSAGKPEGDRFAYRHYHSLIESEEARRPSAYSGWDEWTACKMHKNEAVFYAKHTINCE